MSARWSCRLPSSPGHREAAHPGRHSWHGSELGAQRQPGIGLKWIHEDLLGLSMVVPAGRGPGLALIFAFFLASPAPVCVLDEVDAPLDDKNVLKFCKMVREIARQTDTRFLIVTHHVITMSHMDRLFGVTMQEKGVSQLVSVDLGAAERMAA